VVDDSQGETLLLPLDGSPVSTFQFRSREGAQLGLDPPRLDSSGRFLAAPVWSWGSQTVTDIRVVDLATGDQRAFDTHPEAGAGCEEEGSDNWGVAFPVWLPDGRLVTDGDAGLRVWDLASGTSRRLRPCTRYAGYFSLLASADPLSVLRLDGASEPDRASSLSAYDLASGSTRAITSHGRRVSSLALDRRGAVLVTGDLDGVVRVGPLAGGEPHLLFGHTGRVGSVAVSPDGRWIASGSEDGTIRLWPMPDLSKPPLHTLPHDELLAKLRSLTNLRAVRDPAAETGWTIEVGPFPGWKIVPT
jgi:WD40 repeat protein